MLLPVLAGVQNLSSIIIAAAGAIGVKLLEAGISKFIEYRRKSHDDDTSDLTDVAFQDAERLRRELRQQNAQLRREVEAHKTEANEWRERYWKQVEESSTSQKQSDQVKHLKDKLRNQGLNVDSDEHPTE
jgi:hypothetical protein